MVLLETDRLILRDYEPEDSDAYFKLKSDPKTMYYLQDIQLFSKEEADKELADILADRECKSRKFYFFHAELKASHEQIRKVLEFAFLKNDVYRVTTGCLADNIGSERVMIKCGMVKEAEHIEWEWHDGKMKNRLEYRLLKKEWEDKNFG